MHDISPPFWKILLIGKTGYYAVSTKFSDFPNIFFFHEILSLRLFGIAWGICLIACLACLHAYVSTSLVFLHVYVLACFHVYILVVCWRASVRTCSHVLRTCYLQIFYVLRTRVLGVLNYLSSFTLQKLNYKNSYVKFMYCRIEHIFYSHTFFYTNLTNDSPL